MKKTFSMVVFAVVAVIITVIIVLNKTIVESIAALSPVLKDLFVKWGWMKEDAIVAPVSPFIFASGGGGGGGGTVNVTTLPAFTIKDAYLVGSNYVLYPTLVDAMDKNFENSGFTNRSATIYATAMVNGGIAYADTNATTLYPEGRYFYDTNFEYLYVNPQGVMALFSDIEKPTNLNSLTIKESYQ